MQDSKANAITLAIFPGGTLALAVKLLKFDVLVHRIQTFAKILSSRGSSGQLYIIFLYFCGANCGLFNIRYMCSCSKYFCKQETG